MRVFIAVDGSSGSFEAVRQAASLLSPQRDRIALYYSPPGSHRDANAADEAQFIGRARRALADAVFDQAREYLPPALRENPETIVGLQPANHGITDASGTWKADLIVVGARGLGPIQRLLLGSVSRSVVHAAIAPVLVVRQHRHPEQKPWKVLLACEGAAESKRLAKVIRSLQWPAGTTGRTISVLPSIFGGELPKWLIEKARSPEAEATSRAWVLEHEAALAAKVQEMTHCCRRLPDPFHESVPLVAEGYPADQILEAISREQTDLVVVGARAQGAVSRLLLGSTSEAILSHAACSVLVVREQEGGES